MSWDPRALPPLAGRTVVVTGGNAGIGYFISEQLAGAGARVVIASRSAEKTDAAMRSIRSRVPAAQLAHVQLDLTSLASVREAAAALDAHGRLRTDDVWSERSYARFRAYAASKHAVQIFGFELARRLDAAGDSRRSLIAHPGWATSACASRRPGITDRDPIPGRVFETLTGWVGQGKDRGAWGPVRAFADRTTPNGGYVAPRLGLAGAPVLLSAPQRSLDREVAAHLWADAERLSGVRFPV